MTSGPAGFSSICGTLEYRRSVAVASDVPPHWHRTVEAFSSVQLLQVSWFDLEGGYFHFEQPKVGGTLRHELSRTTRSAVTRYITHDHPHGPLLYGSTQDGTLYGGMSKSAINQRVRFLDRKIGVEQLSPHDCRHFWAWSAVEAGTDLESLKQAGGWASLDMPSRYIKRREVANEKVRLFHEGQGHP
jgi:integrase